MNIDKLQEGVLCSLRMGRWNASAKIETKKLNKEAPEKIFRTMQDLIDDRSILDELISIRNKARYLIANNSMLFPIDNLFFIPKHKIEEIDKELNEYKISNDVLVGKLLRMYEELKREFARKYPNYIDKKIESKYPSKEKLKEKFFFEWSFFHLSLPKKGLDVLSPSIYKREKEKFDKMMEEMEEMAVKIIGEMIVEKVKKLQEQCESGEVNGRTVKSVENLLDKWEDIWKDNMTNQKICNAMKKLKSEMKNVSSISLKDNKQLQAELSKSLSKVVESTEKHGKLKRRLDI